MLVKTPPMGWNSWNTFGENINEQLIMETADAMVSTGLKDAGYEYIVIDDCWSLRERDENGDLVADPEKFPHGMKYLADYIHSKGLKFGMYSCCGPLTCAGYPGSLDREYQDAKFFARNGVDFLKYDWCTHPHNVQGWSLYNRMRMALNATGRDIVYSVCNWGMEDTVNWARKVGADMYRSTFDIADSFKSFIDIFNQQKDNMCLSGPSCYNDMDMLICGMYGKGNVAQGGCNDNEYLTHFAIWCMLSQPLMMGCDIRNMTPETAALLKNAALIAINQDPAVRPPIIKPRDGDEKNPILFKHLAGDDYAIACINLDDSDREYFAINLADFGLSPRDGYGFDLVDVMTGENVGETRGIYKNLVNDCIYINVPAHGVKVYRGSLKKIR